MTSCHDSSQLKRCMCILKLCKKYQLKIPERIRCPGSIIMCEGVVLVVVYSDTMQKVGMTVNIIYISVCVLLIITTKKEQSVSISWVSQVNTE